MTRFHSRILKGPYLFVELQIFHHSLLAFLCNLPQHVVNEPLFFIAVALAAGGALETLEGRLQHGVLPFLHLNITQKVASWVT